MTRLRGVAVAAAAAVLLLAGCSEIPTSGSVQPGTTEAPNDTTIVYLPNPPAPGASQRDIVSGFITAASGGGDFSVAREYLARSFAGKWDPTRGVLVQAAQPTVDQPVGGQVTVDVPISAQVDASGAYRPSSQTPRLTFHLVQQNGQWRIDKAPDGIVIGPVVFQRHYSPQAVEFFDPTWTQLVPDLRWFPVPGRGSTQSPQPAAVVSALAGGPTGPLQNGVTVNALRGVTVDSVDPGTITTVSLTVPGSTPSAAVTARMQQQLIASLQLSNPSALRLVVNGRIAAPAKALAAQPTSLAAYVVADGRFGTLAADGSVTEDPTLGKRIAALSPTDVTVSVRQKLAAVRTASGDVALVGASGAPRIVDTRPGLIAPTLDQRGWVYSVPSNSPDSGIVATDAKGQGITIAADLGGTSVKSIEVSPDGTRMLVLTQSASGPHAFVAGIERNADGTPTGLTSSHSAVDPGGTSGSGLGATWRDDGSVAVLLLAPDNVTDRVQVQQLGGVALPQGQLTTATSIAGTPASRSSLRIRLQTGVLAVYRSSQWQPESSAPTKVSVLAVQR